LLLPADSLQYVAATAEAPGTTRGGTTHGRLGL